MTVPRYQVPGWPANVGGHPAVVPAFVRLAGSGAVAYKDRVAGFPGTLGVPVHPVIPSPDLGDKAQSGLSRSSDAPNVFYPNMYWARLEASWAPGAGMPVSVYSDNLMPVPAGDPRGVPAPLQMGMGVGFSPRPGQIRQPVPLPMWPDVHHD